MNPVDARSSRVAAMFDDLAPTYESVGVPWFVPIASSLVAEVDPRHREHVLDVGCGSGTAIPFLAGAVGPHGRVVGIDLAPRMLERARQAVDLRGLHQVELYEMDAADPDLPAASFNAVTASMLIFFLPDPVAALRRWHDLLVPMGKLGVTTFAGRSPVWERVDALFRHYLPPGMPGPHTVGPELSTDDGVAGLLHQAGFQDVHTTHVDIPVVFASADQWRQWTMTLGQRSWWQAVPEAEREELFFAATDLLEGTATSGGRIELVQTMRLTTGYRSL